MAVGRLREGTNILAAPHSTSVSLETPFNAEISKESLLFTAMCFFQPSLLARKEVWTWQCVIPMVALRSLMSVIPGF